MAPNSIYRESEIKSEAKGSSPKNAVIYVGRFHSKKKVDLLVRGFAEARANVPDLKLLLVGDGEEKKQLLTLAENLGIADHVQFTGWVEDVNVLRKLYAGAFASASPGFAGLGLTQSLGFGVPMAVARNEPHSPEIELADKGAVTWFDSDDVSGIASALVHLWQRRQDLPDEEISSFVRQHYSAESMAHGLLDAFRNK
ncbi:UNVERIFIED_CONTAM: glycosyltransferase [Kocuria sp. CPCC 205274]